MSLIDANIVVSSGERFRMVRVGRAEAMHPLASNISSQQLAQRDLARIHSEQPAPAGLQEEVNFIY